MTQRPDWVPDLSEFVKGYADGRKKLLEELGLEQDAAVVVVRHGSTFVVFESDGTEPLMLEQSSPLEDVPRTERKLSLTVVGRRVRSTVRTLTDVG